jgi:hypothetical protein
MSNQMTLESKLQKYSNEKDIHLFNSCINKLIDELIWNPSYVSQLDNILNNSHIIKYSIASFLLKIEISNVDDFIIDEINKYI